MSSPPRNEKGHFLPGYSGNPKGLPGKPFSTWKLRYDAQIRLDEAICNTGAMTLPDLKDLLNNETNADMLMVVQARLMAIKGSMTAINFLAERILGKVMTSIELSGPDGKAIEIESKIPTMTKQELIDAAEASIKLLKAGGDPSGNE